MSKRLITPLIREAVKRKISLNVVQRFLKLKYRIKASLLVLRKRKENLN
tara:strand:- start:1183 stop:1329 length:147 start_codon:yes stop_codon:yes gene_type:complete